MERNYDFEGATGLRNDSRTNSLYNADLGIYTGENEHHYETISEAKADSSTTINNSHKHDSKIAKDFITELIESEKVYVQKLESSIMTFKEIQKINDEFELLAFRMEKLYKFHKDKLLPQLITCQYDAFNIAQIFHTNLLEDNFYDYVLCVWDKPKMQQFSNMYKNCGKNVESSDNCVEPCDIWPLVSNRLIKYKWFFREIMKMTDCGTDILRAFGMTFRQLEILLNTVEDAEQLNEMDADKKFKVHQQGKFRKCTNFQISCPEFSTEFQGKVFLFENCLLCTNHTPQKIIYRTHINRDAVKHVISFENNFTVITVDGQEYQFYGEQANVKEWTEILNKSEQRESSFGSGNINWNEQKYVDQLIQLEMNYITSLNKYKKAILGGTLTRRIQEFASIYDEIIRFHTQQIYAVLQSHDLDLLAVLELFQSVFQEDAICNAYKRYSLLACTIKTEIQKHLINQQRFDDICYLPRMLETPLFQLKRYKNFFGNIIMKTISKNVNDEEDKRTLRSVAKTQVEVNRFVDLITDNYKIQMQFNIPSVGSIQYSDRVHEKPSDQHQFRIFLMEYAVVALDSKTDPKDSNNELFTEWLWSIPYKEVKYRDSTKIDERIKMYSKILRYPEYSVIFKTSEKKKQFIKRLMDMPDY